MPSRIFTALKYFFQFGPQPLILFGLYKLGLRFGQFKRLNIEKWEASQRPQTLFSLPSREELEKTLGVEGKNILIQQADEIVNGQARVFGELTALDFTNPNLLEHWTQYETNHTLLSSFNFPHHDIKYLWEPARFAFAYTLGRAYHLTQDEKYAQSFWKYFESFTKNNPANLGPHWMNGQEVALRVQAFVWAWHVFGAESESDQERSAALIQSIYEHAQRIPSTLMYARSQNNNHLLTESAAIYAAGLFFKNVAWRNLGWKWLNWSFQKQIGDFGEYIQHSTNYHRLMLQTALWINFIKQDRFPSDTLQSLARSTHWLFSLLDNASGRVPNLGANDGALILPLSSSSFEDYRPTIQAAIRAFSRMTLASGIWDELSLWLGLKAKGHEADSSIYLIENLRAQNSWAYLRASSFKSRLSHMDQLHVDLWWRGLNVAQDAGTFLYNAEAPWDNPLVGSFMHNTVTVDGREQMSRAGRFLVLDWASAYAKPKLDRDEKILHRMRGYFTGWRRIAVSHERTVTVYEDEFWQVEDRLLNRRKTHRTYRLHWLLCDGDWRIEETEQTTKLFLQTENGNVKLTLRHPANQSKKISLVRAGEVVYGERNVQPCEGWVSRNYGQKTPALSLALEIESMYHVLLSSEFEFEK